MAGFRNFTFLAPGTYNVRIRDAAHTCVIILDPALVITQPTALAAAVARTNVTCFGANDGTITISAPPADTAPMNTRSMAALHGRGRTTLLPWRPDSIMFR